MKLFKTFDEDLKRKENQKYWNDSLSQHWSKPLMAVYFYCGLRRNEAAFKSELPYSGLKYQNIYFEKSQPVLIDLSATKGQQERTIPIPKKCQQLLIEYLNLRGNLNYDDYIFIYTGTHKRGWPVTGARTYREFKHYLNLADLPASRTIHGMRHRRVTTWLEEGFNTFRGVKFRPGIHRATLRICTRT